MHQSCRLIVGDLGLGDAAARANDWTTGALAVGHRSVRRTSSRIDQSWRVAVRGAYAFGESGRRPLRLDPHINPHDRKSEPLANSKSRSSCPGTAMIAPVP